MKKIYPIPKGSTYVTIETNSDNDLIVIFEPCDSNAFLSEITCEIEYIPEKNDLAILWLNQESRGKAIIANVDDVQFDDSSLLFESNNQWFSHAILFRSKEQYSKIINKS